MLALCFLWGGTLGTVVAGTLEYDLARSLGFLPKLGIGLFEEGAKIIVPLAFYALGRYRSEATGLLVGVATAAGFAGLETMGYGFVSLLRSRGDLAVLDEVLILRGLTSPAGHPAWTGLVNAVLWRERLRAGPPSTFERWGRLRQPRCCTRFGTPSQARGARRRWGS